MADYGSPPYHESAAKSALRLLLAGAPGWGAVPPGANFGAAFLASGGRSAVAGQQAQEAAQRYALAQMELERRKQEDEMRQSLLNKPPKEEAPKPYAPMSFEDWKKQQDYLSGLRIKEQQSKPTAAGKAPPDAEAVSSLADAMHSMGYAALQGLGMGAAGLREAVVAEHARKYPNDDLATISANYGALRGTLGTMQRGISASEGFADTAQNAMNLLDSTISGVPDTGIVPFNFVLRNVGRATGNENITAFDNARQVVNTELGRILGQGFLSNGTQLTDSMRHEIREGMNPSATRGQLRAALGILRTDLGFKIGAGERQLQTIKGRIAAPSGGGAADPFTGLYK